MTDWTALTRSPGRRRSRSINAENPTGAAGSAGSAASHLGPGRKGSAYLPLAAGDTLTLADVEGPGVIRHIWITVAGPRRRPVRTC